MHPMKLPYELRIGVTGHRELADPAAVARAVRRVLDGIAETLGQSSQVPIRWTVISPLAKGADRIVAAAVLERKNARLQVITPLPLDDYRQDFKTPADRSEFEALLARAEAPHAFGTPGDGPVPEGKERNLAYRRAGRAVVNSCEILICIWDGVTETPPKLGGTADIVAYARKRPGVVLQINPNDLENLPKVDNAAAVSPGYHQQTAFLSDGTIDGGTLQAAIDKKADELRQYAAEASMPATALNGVIANLVPTYVKADQLARAYGKRYRWATNAILFLAAIAVTIASAQIIFRHDVPQFVLAEVVCMLGVLAVWWASRRRHWHEKWLQDRFLAEQLRCAMFVKVVGIADERAVGDRLPFYPGPHQWLDSAVRTLSRATAAEAVPLEALRAFLCAAWLADQQQFHVGTAQRKKRQAKRRHQLGLALFVATLLMALLHFSGAGDHFDQWMGTEHADPLLQTKEWIEFLALVFPAWAASIHAITSQLEFERIAARSAGMKEELEDLIIAATESKSLAALQASSLEAAELMAAESREWWALLSFQHLNIHA